MEFIGDNLREFIGNTIPGNLLETKFQGIYR